MSNDDTVDLRWILAVMRRWAWLIVGCALLALIVAFIAMSLLPPKYSATTTLLVLPTADGRANDYNDLVAGERLALTYSRMLKEWPTLETAIARLGLSEKPDVLAKRVKAEPVKDTQLLRLTVTDSSPAQAALLADAIAEAFSARVRALHDERSSGSLLSVQGKMDALQTLIEQTESKAQVVAAEKTDDEAQLASLATLLAEYRSDRRTLQQNQQALQLVVSQMTATVRIVDNARSVGDTAQSPYTAVVTLMVDQPPAVSAGGYSAAVANDRLAATYAQMLSTRSVLEAVIAELKTGESAESLAKRITAEAVTNTQLIRISVVGNDMVQTMRLADTLAATLINKAQGLLTKPYTDRLAGIQEQISGLSALIEQAQARTEELTSDKLQMESEQARLQRLLAEYRSDYRTLQQSYEQMRSTAVGAADAVVITERAHTPSSPTQGRTRYIVLGALVGAMVGLGISFLAEYLDETLRTPENVSAALGLGTLGTIGQISNRTEGLIVATHPQSPTAEAFRMLATNVRLWRPSKPVRTILVTSPCPTEGKSVVTANLAAAMARSGLRVVAVDADLRLPQLHQLFGLNREHGVTDYVAHGTLDGNLQPTQIAGLRVVTSGDLATDPVEVMNSPRMAKLLAELAQMADVVIIDSPPVLVAADATILAAAADGVLLVLRSGQTETRVAQDAVETLRQARAKLVGAVLNDVPNARDGYYSYHHNGSGTTAKARLSVILGQGNKHRQRQG